MWCAHSIRWLCTTTRRVKVRTPWVALLSSLLGWREEEIERVARLPLAFLEDGELALGGCVGARATGDGDLLLGALRRDKPLRGDMPVRERKGDDAMQEDRPDTDDRAGAAMHTDLLAVLEEVVADHDGVADAQPWLAEVNRLRDDTAARELDDPVVLAVAAPSRGL